MATRSITSPEKTDREVTEEMTTGFFVNEVLE
jgi:50S ribosomal subunit-associated GTPase HflX